MFWKFIDKPVHDFWLRVNTHVIKGDKVLFGKYSGTEVKLDTEELLVMRGEDIMAVVE